MIIKANQENAAKNKNNDWMVKESHLGSLSANNFSVILRESLICVCVFWKDIFFNLFWLCILRDNKQKRNIIFINFFFFN